MVYSCMTFVQNRQKSIAKKNKKTFVKTRWFSLLNDLYTEKSLLIDGVINCPSRTNSNKCV